MPCSQMSIGLLQLSNPINCSNNEQVMMLGMMWPCCYGPVKCQQQIPTPCVNYMEYSPNSEITINNNTMLCSQMSIGLHQSGPINCSNNEQVMMLGMMWPCCYGPVKCHQQIPTPCVNDMDYSPNSEITYIDNNTINGTMPCSQMSIGLLQLSNPINCSNNEQVMMLGMMWPCCYGPVKCQQQIPTPCVNYMDYSPNSEITINNNTMLCSQMSIGLHQSGPINCSNNEQVMMFGMMQPCCYGPVKCQQQIPCVNDMDYSPNSEITIDNNA